MNPIEFMRFTNINNKTELLVTIDNQLDIDSVIFELALSICSIRNIPEREIEESWWYKAYTENVGFSDIEEAEIVEAEDELRED